MFTKIKCQEPKVKTAVTTIFNVINYQIKLHSVSYDMTKFRRGQYNRKSASLPHFHSADLISHIPFPQMNLCYDNITFPYGEYYSSMPSVQSSNHPLECVTVCVWVRNRAFGKISEQRASECAFVCLCGYTLAIIIQSSMHSSILPCL